MLDSGLPPTTRTYKCSSMRGAGNVAYFCPAPRRTTVKHVDVTDRQTPFVKRNGAESTGRWCGNSLLLELTVHVLVPLYARGRASDPCAVFIAWPRTRTLHPLQITPAQPRQNVVSVVKPGSYHCMSARLSSPSSKFAPCVSSCPFVSSLSPSRSKSLRLVWRILISRRSTGPLVRASWPSCLLRMGSTSPVQLAREGVCLVGTKHAMGFEFLGVNFRLY